MTAAAAPPRRRPPGPQDTAPLPELADIKAALSPGLVLRWAGIEVNERGRGDLFGHQCPREYHRQSPRAFTMNRETGQWTCYACAPRDGKPLGGDLLRLIAEREHLATSGDDFVRVKVIAAEIAGVTGAWLPPEERARRRRAHHAAIERSRRERVDQRRRHRADSIEKATAHWGALALRHEPGERELAARGVAGALDLGIVRFDLGDHGSIAMPLYTGDGQIANVIRRRLPAFAPTKDDRFRPLAGLWAMGTYVKPISDLTDGRDVVLTEGFFDSITAAIAWRAARVVGARSASDLPTIARLIAPRVKELGVRLWLVPHHDNAGFDATAAACVEAHRAGLRLATQTLGIVKHGAADLNDAWRAGWRPQAESATWAAS